MMHTFFQETTCVRAQPLESLYSTRGSKTWMQIALWPSNAPAWVTCMSGFQCIAYPLFSSTHVLQNVGKLLGLNPDLIKTSLCCYLYEMFFGLLQAKPCRIVMELCENSFLERMGCHSRVLQSPGPKDAYNMHQQQFCFYWFLMLKLMKFQWSPLAQRGENLRNL